MSLTYELMSRLLGLEADDLMETDFSAVRSLFLDHVGVAANGSRADSALVMQQFAGVTETSKGLPIIGTPFRGDPLMATMVNAVAAHSIEYDDVHNAASSHPGVVVFPAAIAASCITEYSAEKFIMGVIVGYEAMCRVGRAANPQSHYARHFHPTGTTGHIGAAAAASSILGLDLNQSVSALGIAATMAAGSMQFLVDGAWTKRLHPAQAARNGVEAALLSQAGFVGTEDGVAGDRGFLAGYSDESDPEELLKEWGDRSLEVQNTSIKAHTCCRYNQGPIDAILEICTDHDLESEKVAKIKVGIPTVAEDIIWQPEEFKRRPISVVDAQFSLPYAAAVAVVRRRASLPEYDGSLFQLPEILRNMDNTECVVDSDLDRTYPQQWRAWAEIETVDGEIYKAVVDDPKGDPTNPLSSTELVEKFVEITEGIYSSERQKQLISEITSFGFDSNLNSIVNSLSSDIV